jgi:hypothetical protein
MKSATGLPSLLVGAQEIPFQEFLCADVWSLPECITLKSVFSETDDLE